MNDDSNSGDYTHDEAHSSQNNVETNAPVAAAPAASDATASNDHSDHKLFAILGYILPFLFFLPMLQEGSKNDPFARFHANQQLVILAVWLAVYVVSTVLFSMMYMPLFFLMPLINLALLVLAILGIINAAQGEMKPLPVIGKFELLHKLFK
jgi:uncharacterized membrane protein